MKTVQQQKDQILKAFIAPTPAIEDALHSYVKVIGANECLRLAVIAGQPDIMHSLINGHGASVHQTRKEGSNRGNGTIKRNLMDEVIDSLLHNKDIDRSAEGKDKFYAVINLLAERNVGVNINADPLESPLMGAHLLAFPQLAQDRNTPHYDLIVGTVLEEKPEAFKKIYAFLLGRFPDEARDFEQALDGEKTRLRTQFSAARRMEEETTPEPRRIGPDVSHLVFSALDRK